MDRVKKGIFAVGIFSLLLSTNVSAFADDFGYVDINKVLSSYSKAQEVNADLKIKDAELKKFVAEAQKDVKSAKTPDAAKQLEEKYNKELQAKSDSIKKEKLVQINNIEKAITTAIKATAVKKKVTTVLRRESVLFGGIDLTSDVVSILKAK